MSAIKKPQPSKITDTDADDRAERRAAARAGQQQKMDWAKALLADGKLGHAAKTVGVAAALNLAYSKMEFRATCKELGRLSGTTANGADKAAKILAEKNYWKIRRTPGANTYTLVPQAAREQMWYRAECEWLKLCHEWDCAKRDWEYQVNRWLEGETTYRWLVAEEREKHEYTTALFSVLLDRGADFQLAYDACERAWKHHQTKEHAPVDEFGAFIRKMPEDQFRQMFTAPDHPALTTDQLALTADQPAPVADQPAVTADQPAMTNAVISGNDRSTSSSRFSRTEELQDAHALRAAEPARDALASTVSISPQWLAEIQAEITSCPLCDDHGDWLVNSQPVRLLDADNPEFYKDIYCTHSLAENLTILQEEAADDEYIWVLVSTGDTKVDELFSGETLRI